jgi:type I restriction enzyme S subunit
MGEWKRCKLGDVIELKRGYDLPQKERQPGGVPVVSSSGISDKHAVAKVKGPGVVTGRYGTIGTVYYIVDDFWPLNTTLYVRDFKGNDPRFVSYFLRGIDFHAYSDKAAVPGLNRNHLHEASVLIPTLPEQRAIAATLGALDDKIELNRKMNATLEAMARALFRDWFVDFGPTRAKMAGRPPYLSPDLWPLFPARLDADGKPEGWEVSTIGDEVHVVGGSTPSTKEPDLWDGGINWATPKDLSTLAAPVLLETARTISTAGLAKISSGLLPVGSLLLSSRAPIGYLAIAEVPVAINQGFIGMICDKRLSNVFAWLWTLENMDAILAKANGSTFQEISKGNFRPLPVVVAPDPVLKAFDAIAKPLYDRIARNERESRTLAQTRDLLLPRLMSGEIRVRDAERLVEEAG